ncbi:NADH-quinone oxidoreductase subunit NuoE, partial [Pseudomonas sp. HMWF010]
MSTLIQTDRFTLSASERSAIEHEMHHYEDPRAASIEALKIVQKARGWVPDGAADAIGEILGIPASDVEGVATFYSQIFRQPVGRHIIRVCDSMTCYIGGHEGVLAGIKDQLGIVPG